MRLSPILLTAAGLLCAAACSAPSQPEVAEAPAAPAIDPSKLLDLSYTYDDETIYWPNAEGFRHRKDTWAITEGGYWYAAGDFASAEHGGTHMDSPIHFGQGKRTLDQIPVSDLIRPAAVIDVSSQAAADRDYRATAADITAWESEHGMIEPGMIVVFHTGWGQYWPNRLEYMGSDTPGDTTHLHFPGLGQDAAELLVERRVAGVGIDTASMDYGPSTDFIVHQILNGADIYGMENIANAGLLPATGATIIALPIRIAEGTGGPTRIVALLP